MFYLKPEYKQKIKLLDVSDYRKHGVIQDCINSQSVKGLSFLVLSKLWYEKCEFDTVER